MKLIDLFKIKKARKSQNVPNEKEGKFSKIARNPFQADGYMSSAGETKAKNDGNTDQM